MEPYEQGIRIVFNKVNADGGIYGRKINWILYDDGYQPARTVAGIKKLVESDNVFLLFGNLGTPTTKAVMPYVEQSKIPYFVAVASPEPISRYTFGLMANYDQVMYQVTKYMVGKLGLKKIGYLYQNDDLGAIGRIGVERALKEFNVKLTADVGFERGTNDFSTQVLKLRDAGADGVVSMSIGPATANAVKQALGIGYKPTWGTFSVGGAAVMQQLLGSAVDGMVFGSEIDTQYTDSPATREVKALLAKYYPGVPVDWGTMIGYAHATLLIDALKAAGPNLTREGVIAALEGKTYDLGVMAPVSYSPTKRTAANAIAVFRWKGGKAERVTDWVPNTGSAGVVK
ncbi:MAG: ABC transporter substrate-binding protein, partial [Pseudomonadota bacterium]|nr:ABC transporter substrate-binding protein [Pseudomonadota bacterium]